MVMSETAAESGPPATSGAPLSEIELFRITPVPLVFTSMDGTIVDANPAALELYGLDRDAVVGSHAWEHKEIVADEADLVAALAAWQERRSHRNMRQTLVRSDGQERRVQSSFEPIRYHGVDGMVIVAIDLTEQLATQSALHRSNEALRLRERAFAATSSGMVIFDAQASGTPIVSVNPAYAQMLGVTEADLLGMSLRAFSSGYLLAGSQSTMVALLDARHERSGTLVHRHRDGERIVTEARFAPVLDAAGQRTHYVGVLQDVTDRMATEAELRLRSLLLDEAPAAILAITADGVITHWNAQAERLLGWPRSDAIGARLSEFAGSSSFHLVARSMLDRAQAGEPWEGEAQLTVLDGKIIDIQATSTPIPALGTRGPGMVAVVVDITDRKDTEGELHRLAISDPVTGLPNRARFVSSLQVALSYLEPEQTAAIFFINVDQVRALTASLGHEHGDHALLGVAERLSALIADRGLVSRFSGDTFAVVVPNCGADEAAQLASRMQAELQAPFEILGRDRFIIASIGYTLAGPNQNVTAVQTEADIAQREARKLRLSEPVLFRAEMAATAQRRLDLETDLRQAVREAQFTLVFQPIVSLSARTIVACEALIRWKRPDGTLVLPGEFIPLAEEIGVVIPIGQWVLEEVCRTIVQWDAELGDRKSPEVHVNISPDQFRQPNFAGTVMATLDHFGVDPKRIALEVTETTAMTDADQSLAQSRALRQVGVKLAMDDFGAGYSNLGLLNKLPVQMLKIDRSFAHEIETEPGIGVITRALIQLGRDLGMVVTGEGIETAEQADRLAGLGANRGQGYFFARPMPAEEFLKLLQLGPSLRLPR